VSNDESAVIVCNHQSSLDVIGGLKVWSLTPRCAFAAKKELLYAGFFGITCWLSGMVFLDRSNPAKAKESLNHTQTLLTKEKVKLFIFPEGTRNVSGTLLPFKKGAFHLAISSQRPVIPITISSYCTFYNKRLRKFDNGGNVIINILPPVSTEGMTIQNINKLVETVKQQMQESLTSTSYEIMQSRNIFNESKLL